MAHEITRQGFIIKFQDLGEADLLLTFFSMEEGKTRLVVKSAKKLTSRLAGRLQPVAELKVSLAGNGSLPKLIGVEVVQSYALIMENEDGLAAIAGLQEFTNRTLPDAQPNQKLYEAYLAALQELMKQPAEASCVLARYYARGLQALGLAPGMVEGLVTNQSKLYLSHQDGRFALKASSADDAPLSAELYHLYLQLLNDEPLRRKTSTELETQLLQLLVGFAAYQLERPLRAPEYFFRK
ncbi:MAG TPA: DNA repair protein RecO [Candidatus Doudnabacteria bacterium]|nr:DNA repair protein RecO [Candidatus Doudnabacteria bacterium]